MTTAPQDGSHRWRFLDRRQEVERLHHERVSALIDRWWSAFAHRTRDLTELFAGRAQWDLPAWMASELQAIDSRLMWEYGPAVKGNGHRLVITPESARELRPLVATVLERAPAVAGWEFYPYRLAEDIGMLQATLEARAGGDLEGAAVLVEHGAHHLVDLTFLSPKAAGPGAGQVLHEALIATETLLGERVMDRWIGAVDVRAIPAPQRGLMRWFRKDVPPIEGAVALADLRAAVDGALAEIRAALRGEPHHEWVADAEWSGFELRPDPADDYAGQSDLFVATTAHRAAWEAARSAGSFYDERFSTAGETFAYVKLDGAGRPDEERFAERTALAEVIDAALRPRALGCEIGGGTGLRYSYIDLALTEVDAALDAVCEALRARKVPRRSWIQFWNADWSHEWVSVYPDAPAPPLPNDGEAAD